MTGQTWCFTSVSFPETHNSTLKNVRQIAKEVYSTKYLTINPQNFQGCQKQEMSEKPSQSRVA